MISFDLRAHFPSDPPKVADNQEEQDSKEGLAI